MAAGAQALSTLLKRIDIDDPEEVLETCNAALKQSKNDLDAQHAKVVALIKLDRHDDAIRCFEACGDGLKKRGMLAHAYALYKVGELEKAQALAREITAGEGGDIRDIRGARHIDAQASYRLENFAEAASLYKTLARSREAENEENDLRINLSATDAQLEWKRQRHLVTQKKVEREDLDAFETAYNAACGCIARGELGQGEVLLKRAKDSIRLTGSTDLCMASDFASEQERIAELLPISVQQLYVLTAMGKLQQAETLAAEIALDDIPDLSTRQIAQINKLTASTTPMNPYLSHRLFHSTSSPPITDKLFKFQEELKEHNQFALDLLVSKFTGVANATARTLSENPSPTISASANAISTANAAAHAQNQLGKLGLKSILPLLEKRPSDVGLVMTVVQLYILTKNHGAAITVMESLLKRLDDSKTATDQDVRFAPGLVATMVSLYTIEGRRSHIRSELTKAASYWRHKSKLPINLLRAAGTSLLDSAIPMELREAGNIFGALRQADIRDKIALAGYVAAYATIDFSRVAVDCKKLTYLNVLIDDIDVEKLVEAGVPHLTPVEASITSRKRAGDENGKPAKKRVRKSRSPKELDPNKPADPERWLPLRDRSTYKPKGKKGKQKAAGLTQGGVSDKAGEGRNVADSDLSKPASTVVSGPSKPQKKKKGKK